ncbi:hypothetical protein sos41_11240 [Alphaproteobacteria bacterium SO-S41]|nr:hypothetical protein sos41_11240 [Alphaproteobacteria bacterium SO-S41]
MPSRFGRTRPMLAKDLEAAAGLFFRAFARRTKVAHAEFTAYYKEVFLDNPLYDESNGCLVHEDSAGQIDGSISFLPMRFVVCGDVVTGRLACAYMSDPDSPGHGGSLALKVRARNNDFCFSDTAAPVSADHWRALGGVVLPVQSLDWRQVFRPMAQAGRRFWNRAPGWSRKALASMVSPGDAMLRRAMGKHRTKPQQGVYDEDMRAEAFVEAAPHMVARFAVHPEWSREELAWTVRMAARKQALGPLGMRAVVGPGGVTLGCFIYYGAPGMPAAVLNVLSEPGWESAVVAQMLHYFDREGFTSASGVAQPFLMNAFGRQPGVNFRHRAYFCVSTKRDDVREAVMRGDFYAGGLAGEAWSRLTSDF